MILHKRLIVVLFIIALSLPVIAQEDDSGDFDSLL